MPNIAAVLKEEIRRLARKEVRAFSSSAKQAVSHYRKDIAWLKRVIRDQQKAIAGLSKESQSAGEPEAAQDDPLADVRFSARSVRAQRNRLGLSAADYGRLIGVSGLTIYSWEHGKSRPRRAQLAALIAVRGIGKRAALEQLQTAGAARGRKKKAKR
ncbi:MAG: helix-turn-helix domain-containing protein [Thermoguttaceae bacterium]